MVRSWHGVISVESALHMQLIGELKRGSKGAT